MSQRELYVGTWELVPELSLYEVGPRPSEGVYEVESGAEDVRIRIRWKLSPEEAESRTEFAGPPDGTLRTLDNGVAYCLTRIDERTLDSTAFRGDEILAYARRVVSTDGELMAIVQEGPRPEGGRFRNFQVYRRTS
jgi:hypothetical protein